MIRFLSVFCLLSTTLFGQNNLRFTHYTTRDGLSDNYINYLFQDSRGLLWIGTSNGLNYFDGVSFQNIYPSDFDPIHLHSDAVGRIAENTNGNILLITNDGMEEYNWKSKNLRLIFPLSMNGGVSDFIIDKKKNIWLLSRVYLQQYDPHFNLLKSIQLDSLQNKVDKISFNVGFYCVDNANNIWFHHHDIIYEWNITTNMLESKLNNPYKKKLFYSKAYSIVPDAKGNYWTIIHNSEEINDLACYQSGLNSFRYYHLTKNVFTDKLILTHSGKLWAVSNNGFIVFDISTASFQIISYGNLDSNSVYSSYATQLYEDKDGNIWIATLNGLDKYNNLPDDFIVLNKFGYESRLNLSNKTVVNSITPYNFFLFVSTSAGLFKINTESFQQLSFRKDKRSAIPEDNYWLSFFTDESTLFTTTWKGVFVFKNIEKKLQPEPFLINHPVLMDSLPVVSVFKDRNWKFWLSMPAGNGIYCWNKNDNTFTKYDQYQRGKHYCPLRHFSCATEDEDGNIWMGYDKGGITFFDAVSKKFVQPSFPEFNQLNQNVIHDILSDRRGNLWISTPVGLICYTLKSHQLKRYNRTDGLISNLVNGMAMDEKGILWIGTSNSLSRFDTATKQFTNFTAADGLPSEAINQVIYDSVIRKICFTTDHTVGLFDPYFLKKINPSLSPIVTSFYVMGKQRSINDSTVINLSYNENFFFFNYTAADLIGTADVRYEYKLQGLNNNWIKADKRQYAGFTNLDGGNYVFKVRASTDGFQWYEMSSPVLIHIATPFHKTVWFYLLISVAIAAVTFFIFYFVHRAQIARIVTALKIRNDIASDLHDDIGSSLSSIMLMSELAKKQQAPAGDYFDKIKINAGAIIENMNDIVWAVNPNNDTMEQLLVRMQSFASALLEKKNIEFDFKTSDSLSTVKLTMEERKNFYLIFKEVIHNAFKYAACSKVAVQINNHAKAIHMVVEDDGKGFKTEEKYTGNGLNSMKKRAGEINGKLDIISSCDKGTTVTLSFVPTQKGS